MADVTPAQLLAIAPHAPIARLAGINSAMLQANITTPLRQAAFLAQCAHESEEWQVMEEIWGPTHAQLGYEGRHDLGNTEPGDGYRFRGRGDIECTGRKNYARASKVLGVDFVSNPDLAAQPPYSHLIAAWFWTDHNLNRLADDGDFLGITKVVNGGYNGLVERQLYFKRACDALGAVLVCGA